MLQLSSKVLSIQTKNHSVKRFIKQVCIQLPTSADNVTLPAFAAVGHVVHISCPQGPQLQTHRGGWTMGQTDRRTDAGAVSTISERSSSHDGQKYDMPRALLLQSTIY